MLRTVFGYYTYEFREENDVIVAYFQTKTHTEYRVYFYPAREYFDILEPQTFIYKYGYYFGFTKVEPNEFKKEHFDARVMNTIIAITNDFYERESINCILIFHTSDDWGAEMKYKRANRFKLSFQDWDGKHNFLKHDEEIIVNHIETEDGGIITDKEYMSLIIRNTNQNIKTILDEFQNIKYKYSYTK